MELGPLLLNDLRYNPLRLFFSFSLSLSLIRSCNHHLFSLQDPEYNRTGIPQLIRNPFSWTKLGSVLIVDAPPPVGFSYCTQYGPTGNGTSCGKTLHFLIFTSG